MDETPHEAAPFLQLRLKPKMACMDEGRKRVLLIDATIVAARGLKGHLLVWWGRL
jgi:hypothetical protein